MAAAVVMQGIMLRYLEVAYLGLTSSWEEEEEEGGEEEEGEGEVVCLSYSSAEDPRRGTAYYVVSPHRPTT